MLLRSAYHLLISSSLAYPRACKLALCTSLAYPRACKLALCTGAKGLHRGRQVDTELVYAYAKTGDLGALEEFISGAQQANLQARTLSHT